MVGIDVGYEYVNARLRAMRSRLLQRADLEQLLASPTVEALIGQLDQGPYHDALEQSLVTASGLDAVLRAVQIGHDSALRQVVAFGGDTTAPALAVLLAPYQRHNVVALLRGVSARTRAERILPWLVALPPFTEARLVDLARQATLRNLVDLLAQWQLPTLELAGILVAALAETPELPQLTAAFDQAWAETTTQLAAELPGQDGTLVRLDLERLLDLTNLLFTINLRQTPLATPVPWLPGGRLSTETLDALRTAADSTALRDVMQAAPGGEFWRPALEQWDGEHLTSLQHLWEDALVQWRTSLFVQADPLGVGPLIAYLAAKGAEARNLRLVAEAVAGNLGREDARARWFLRD
jgi:vacuolar-type H+-ATPase subunit C/Vma6